MNASEPLRRLRYPKLADTMVDPDASRSIVTGGPENHPTYTTLSEYRRHPHPAHLNDVEHDNPAAVWREPATRLQSRAHPQWAQDGLKSEGHSPKGSGKT